MNVKLIKEWISELKKYAQEAESCRHLRFPMFMESVVGDMFSPEGVLCVMHAKAGLGKWLPTEGEDKKLRGNTYYDGSAHVAPESVLKWVGLAGAIMSEMRRANGEQGFEGAIKYLEGLIDGRPRTDDQRPVDGGSR